MASRQRDAGNPAKGFAGIHFPEIQPIQRGPAKPSGFVGALSGRAQSGGTRCAKKGLLIKSKGPCKDKSYLQGYHKEKPPKRNWTAFFIPR